MPNFVDVRATPIARLSAAFDRIRIYRSATIDGVYAEITNATTRLVLSPMRVDYLYIDATGAATDYYRYEYSSTVSGAVSEQSAPFQGQTAFTDELLTADDLRQFFLFGIPLVDPRTNEPLPDSFYNFYIASAIGYVERLLDIPLRETAYTAETHPFYKTDYDRYMWIQLLHYPVISVEEVRFSLPSTSAVTTFDPSWINVTNATGVIEILPGNGQVMLESVGLSSLWSPLLSGHGKYIPGDIWSVDYTAGFTALPPELRELVGRVAALGPLTVIGDLIYGVGVGGTQVGLDMLMTRVQTTKTDTSSAFGARIRQYKAEIKELISALRLVYKGPRMVVV